MIKCWSIVLLSVLQSAGATRPSTVSVADFASLLQSPEYRSNSKTLAHKLAQVTLSERISADTLAKLLTESPTPETSAVIEAQAARSAFLPLPRAEVPDIPIPTAEERKQLISNAGKYVAHYIATLPNFLCRETILRFDNDRNQPQYTGIPIGDLRFRDVVRRRANFFDKHENLAVEQINNKPATQQPNGGIESHGEFGNLMALLFAPASHNTAVFAHWETIGGKTAAVFSYSVQQANSGYTVTTTTRDGKGLVTVPIAFYGTLSVDRASGAVLRITLRSGDISDNYLLRSVRLAIDYGPMTLGTDSFTCPLRSIVESDSLVPFPGSPFFYHVATLNETSYSDYQRFQTEAHLNFGAPAATSQASEAAAVAPDDALAPWLAKLEPDNPVAADDPPASPLPATPALPSKEPSDSTAQAAATSPPIPKFRQGVSEVVVPVVVWDRPASDSAGKAIDGLQQQDFEVFDAGKHRPIVSFAVERYRNHAANSPADRSGTEEPSGTIAPLRFVALVFDDFHLSATANREISDAAIRFLQQDLSDTRYAVYSMSGQPLLDFTSDRSKIFAAVRSLRSRPLDPQRAGCPKMTYDEADRIAHKNDSYTLSLAVTEAIAVCGFPKTPALVSPLMKARAQEVLNESDHYASTETRRLLAIVHRMSSLRGERSMILISPGYPNADDTPGLQPVTDEAIRSGITISALDASGLAGGPLLNASDSLTSNGDLLSWKESTVTRERIIESETVAEYADETGGRVVRNNNDFFSAFRLLTEPPDVIYLVAFSPIESGQKSAFHALQVKVRGYPASHIQARKGYQAEASR